MDRAGFKIDPDYVRHLQDATHDVLAEVARDVETDARRNAPVDTGRLRGSIHTVWDGEDVLVGSNVDYASYVERGTSRQHAQPYLRPALYKRRS